MLDILNNKHFLQIAALLSVAQSAGWQRDHPAMPSVRETLDQLSRFIHAGPHAFNNSMSLKHEFVCVLVDTLNDIVKQDHKLQYSTDDAQWIFESLYSNDASTTFSMLFAVSVAQQKWYSAEEVSQFTGQSAGTWKNKAAAGEIYAVERAGVRTWIFPELALRAFGVNVSSMKVEIETESDDNRSNKSKGKNNG